MPGRRLISVFLQSGVREAGNFDLISRISGKRSPRLNKTTLGDRMPLRLHHLDKLRILDLVGKVQELKPGLNHRLYNLHQTPTAGTSELWPLP